MVPFNLQVDVYGIAAMFYLFRSSEKHIRIVRAELRFSSARYTIPLLLDHLSDQRSIASLDTRYQLAASLFSPAQVELRITSPGFSFRLQEDFGMYHGCVAEVCTARMTG